MRIFVEKKAVAVIVFKRKTPVRNYMLIDLPCDLPKICNVFL
jgi:hypothetical protein